MREALYNDTCRGCGDAIAKGDNIHWTQADGPRCADCGPAPADERRGSATADEDQPGYVRTLHARIDELESKIDKQYEDKTALEVWAKKLSAELDIAEPEMPA